MAQYVEGLAVARGQDPHRDGPKRFHVGFERSVEVDDDPVGRGGDGRLGEPSADSFGHIARPDSLGIFLDRSVR